MVNINDVRTYTRIQTLGVIDPAFPNTVIDNLRTAVGSVAILNVSTNVYYDTVTTTVTQYVVITYV